MNWPGTHTKTDYRLESDYDIRHVFIREEEDKKQEKGIVRTCSLATGITDVGVRNSIHMWIVMDLSSSCCTFKLR